jgi:hypothetical protein
VLIEVAEKLAALFDAHVSAERADGSLSRVPYADGYAKLSGPTWTQSSACGGRGTEMQLEYEFEQLGSGSTVRVRLCPAEFAALLEEPIIRSMANEPTEALASYLAIVIRERLLTRDPEELDLVIGDLAADYAEPCN